MSKAKVPPTLEQVRTTAAKAKLACQQMKQAGEMLEETLLKLEAKPVLARVVNKTV